jgi:hypothetical protein
MQGTKADACQQGMRDARIHLFVLECVQKYIFLEPAQHFFGFMRQPIYALAYVYPSIHKDI